MGLGAVTARIALTSRRALARVGLGSATASAKKDEGRDADEAGMEDGDGTHALPPPPAGGPSSSTLLLLFFCLLFPLRIYNASRPRIAPTAGNVRYQWVVRTTLPNSAQAHDESAKAAGGGSPVLLGESRGLSYAHMGMVERLPNGSIAVAFQGASEKYEGSVEQSIYLSMSHDGGISWSPATAVVSGDGVPVWSPVLHVEGGRLWLFFSRSNRKCRYFDRMRAVVRHSPGGDVLYTTSDDSGGTWTSPQLVYAYGDESGIPKVISNKVAVLSDGHWLLPFWREPGKTCPVVRNRLPPAEWVNGSAGVLITGDQGLTWSVHGKIIPPEKDHEGWLIENTVAELPGQQLLQFFRSRQGALYQSWSADMGRTWSVAERTSIPNPDSKPHLLRLRNGQAARGTHLICAYNDSPLKRTPLSLAVSHDPFGRNWHVLGSVETADDLEFSYPTMLETKDRILTVYSVMQVQDGVLTFMGIKIASVSAKLIF